MPIIVLVVLIALMVASYKYDRYSWNKDYVRCKVNARHPDWRMNCDIDFLEKDPQWFRDNGYSDWVK